MILTGSAISTWRLGAGRSQEEKEEVLGCYSVDYNDNADFDSDLRAASQMLACVYM